MVTERLVYSPSLSLDDFLFVSPIIIPSGQTLYQTSCLLARLSSFVGRVLINLDLTHFNQRKSLHATANMMVALIDFAVSAAVIAIVHAQGNNDPKGNDTVTPISTINGVVFDLPAGCSDK